MAMTITGRSGRFALPVVAAAIVLSSLSAPAAAEAVPGSADTLLLVSTRDDPFFGGRVVTANLFDVSAPGDQDALFLTFQRVDPDGYRMPNDPASVMRLNYPAALVAGETYSLDGSDADVLWLSDNYQWQAAVCPDLSGSLTIDDLTVGGAGSSTQVAGDFVVHCTPADTVYGSFGVGLPAPPLPEGAQAAIDVENQYPSLVSVFDGESANTIGVDVHRHTLLMRWDTPTGFSCADAAVEEHPDGPIHSYSGRDDTLRVGNLDPSKRHTVTYSLGASGSVCEPLVSDSLSVFPIATSLHTLAKDLTAGEPVSLHGRATTRFEGYQEPAGFVGVMLKGRKVDGSVINLGRTVSDVDGRYRLQVAAKHNLRVFAVVLPGHAAKEPWQPRAPAAGTFYHFGDRSPGVALTVRRR